MKLSNIFKFMSLVTILALIYIHMQMQIFNLAYQGTWKQKQIMHLTERNGMVTYDILALKSSNHLGGTLLADNSDLHFRDPDNVVQLAAVQPERSNIAAPAARRSNVLLSFLSSLRQGTEARAAEQKNRPRPWPRP